MAARSGRLDPCALTSPAYLDYSSTKTQPQFELVYHSNRHVKESKMATQQDIDLLEIDARQLGGLLESGKVTSLDLVGRYVAQIQRHDSKLHAMIQTTSIDLLEQTARSLDQERVDGKIRGPLHGIPITIKVSEDPLATEAQTTLLNPLSRTISPLTQALDCRLVLGALRS